MAMMSDEDRRRLAEVLRASFDEENAGDAEAFARNFLHNGEYWDMLAEAFPEAPPSAIRAVMTSTFGAWSAERVTATRH